MLNAFQRLAWKFATMNTRSFLMEKTVFQYLHKAIFSKKNPWKNLVWPQVLSTMEKQSWGVVSHMIQVQPTHVPYGDPPKSPFSKVDCGTSRWSHGHRTTTFLLGKDYFVTIPCQIAIYHNTFGNILIHDNYYLTMNNH